MGDIQKLRQAIDDAEFQLQEAADHIHKIRESIPKQVADWDFEYFEPRKLQLDNCVRLELRPSLSDDDIKRLAQILNTEYFTDKTIKSLYAWLDEVTR